MEEGEKERKRKEKDRENERRRYRKVGEESRKGKKEVWRGWKEGGQERERDREGEKSSRGK